MWAGDVIVHASFISFMTFLSIRRYTENNWELSAVPALSQSVAAARVYACFLEIDLDLNSVPRFRPGAVRTMVPNDILIADRGGYSGRGRGWGLVAPEVNAQTAALLREVVHQHQPALVLGERSSLHLRRRS